jgi:hypothetical protein
MWHDRLLHLNCQQQWQQQRKKTHPWQVQQYSAMQTRRQQARPLLVLTSCHVPAVTVTTKRRDSALLPLAKGVAAMHRLLCARLGELRRRNWNQRLRLRVAEEAVQTLSHCRGRRA